MKPTTPFTKLVALTLIFCFSFTSAVGYSEVPSSLQTLFHSETKLSHVRPPSAVYEMDHYLQNQDGKLRAIPPHEMPPAQLKAWVNDQKQNQIPKLKKAAGFDNRAELREGEPFRIPSRVRNEDVAHIVRIGKNYTTRFYRHLGDSNAPDDSFYFNAFITELAKAANQRGKIRVLLAGASIGAEAYTVAMELLAKGVNPFQIQIVAVDGSPEAVAIAKMGRYTKIPVEKADRRLSGSQGEIFFSAIPADILRNYFEVEGDTYAVKQIVKDIIDFRVMDITDTAGMLSLGQFHGISFRSVLYLLPENTWPRVITTLTGMIFTGGHLLFEGGAPLFNDHLKLYVRTNENQTGLASYTAPRAELRSTGRVDSILREIAQLVDQHAPDLQKQETILGMYGSMLVKREIAEAIFSAFPHQSVEFHDQMQQQVVQFYRRRYVSELMKISPNFYLFAGNLRDLRNEKSSYAWLRAFSVAMGAVATLQGREQVHGILQFLTFRALHQENGSVRIHNHREIPEIAAGAIQSDPSTWKVEVNFQKLKTLLGYEFPDTHNDLFALSLNPYPFSGFSQKTLALLGDALLWEWGAKQLEKVIQTQDKRSAAIWSARRIELDQVMSDRSFGQIAQKSGLLNLVRAWRKHEGRGLAPISGAASFEAILGAVYLSGGQAQFENAAHRLFAAAHGSDDFNLHDLALHLRYLDSEFLVSPGEPDSNPRAEMRDLSKALWIKFAFGGVLFPAGCSLLPQESPNPVSSEAQVEEPLPGLEPVTSAVRSNKSAQPDKVSVPTAPLSELRQKLDLDLAREFVGNAIQTGQLKLDLFDSGEEPAKKILQEVLTENQKRQTEHVQAVEVARHQIATFQSRFKKIRDEINFDPFKILTPAEQEKVMSWWVDDLYMMEHEVRNYLAEIQSGKHPFSENELDKVVDALIAAYQWSMDVISFFEKQKAEPMLFQAHDADGDEEAGDTMDALSGAFSKLADIKSPHAQIPENVFTAIAGTKRPKAKAFLLSVVREIGFGETRSEVQKIARGRALNYLFANFEGPELAGLAQKAIENLSSEERFDYDRWAFGNALMELLPYVSNQDIRAYIFNYLKDPFQFGKALQVDHFLEYLLFRLKTGEIPDWFKERLKICLEKKAADIDDFGILENQENYFRRIQKLNDFLTLREAGIELPSYRFSHYIFRPVRSNEEKSVLAAMNGSFPGRAGDWSPWDMTDFVLEDTMNHQIVGGSLTWEYGTEEQGIHSIALSDPLQGQERMDALVFILAGTLQAMAPKIKGRKVVWRTWVKNIVEKTLALELAGINLEPLIDQKPNNPPRAELRINDNDNSRFLALLKLLDQNKPNIQDPWLKFRSTMEFDEGLRLTSSIINHLRTWSRFWPARGNNKGKLLHLAAGNGNWSRQIQFFGPQNLQIWDVDSAPFAAGDRAGIPFTQAAAEDLSAAFPDDHSIDAFLMMFGLEYVDRGKIMNEIKRLAAPGAHGIFVLHHPDSWMIKDLRVVVNNLNQKQEFVQKAIHALKRAESFSETPAWISEFKNLITDPEDNQGLYFLILELLDVFLRDVISYEESGINKEQARQILLDWFSAHEKNLTAFLREAEKPLTNGTIFASEDEVRSFFRDHGLDQGLEVRTIALDRDRKNTAYWAAFSFPRAEMHRAELHGLSDLFDRMELRKVIDEIIEQIPTRTDEDAPYIVSIGGPAGVGKTGFAESLAGRMGVKKGKTLTLSMDHFFKSPEEQKAIGTAWDERHVRLDEVRRVLSSIKAGEKEIVTEKYNRENQKLEPWTISLEGIHYVVFEGLYAIASEKRLGNLAEFSDLTVYMFAEESFLKQWRFEQEKGKPHPRTEDEMERHWNEGILPDLEKNIRPSKRDANFTLELYPFHESKQDRIYGRLIQSMETIAKMAERLSLALRVPRGASSIQQGGPYDVEFVKDMLQAVARVITRRRLTFLFAPQFHSQEKALHFYDLLKAIQDFPDAARQTFDFLDGDQLNKYLKSSDDFYRHELLETLANMIRRHAEYQQLLKFLDVSEPARMQRLIQRNGFKKVIQALSVFLTIPSNRFGELMSRLLALDTGAGIVKILFYLDPVEFSELFSVLSDSDKARRFSALDELLAHRLSRLPGRPHALQIAYWKVAHEASGMPIGERLNQLISDEARKGGKKFDTHQESFRKKLQQLDRPELRTDAENRIFKSAFEKLDPTVLEDIRTLHLLVESLNYFYQNTSSDHFAHGIVIKSPDIVHQIEEKIIGQGGQMRLTDAYFELLLLESKTPSIKKILGELFIQNEPNGEFVNQLWIDQLRRELETGKLLQLDEEKNRLTITPRYIEHQKHAIQELKQVLLGRSQRRTLEQAAGDLELIVVWGFAGEVIKILKEIDHEDPVRAETIFANLISPTTVQDWLKTLGRAEMRAKRHAAEWQPVTLADSALRVDRPAEYLTNDPDFWALAEESNPGILEKVKKMIATYFDSNRQPLVYGHDYDGHSGRGARIRLDNPITIKGIEMRELILKGAPFKKSEAGKRYETPRSAGGYHLEFDSNGNPTQQPAVIDRLNALNYQFAKQEYEAGRRFFYDANEPVADTLPVMLVHYLKDKGPSGDLGVVVIANPVRLQRAPKPLPEMEPAEALNMKLAELEQGESHLELRSVDYLYVLRALNLIGQISEVEVSERAQRYFRDYGKLLREFHDVKWTNPSFRPGATHGNPHPDNVTVSLQLQKEGNLFRMIRGPLHFRDFSDTRFKNDMSKEQAFGYQLRDLHYAMLAIWTNPSFHPYERVLQFTQMLKGYFGEDLFDRFGLDPIRLQTDPMFWLQRDMDRMIGLEFDLDTRQYKKVPVVFIRESKHPIILALREVLEKSWESRAELRAAGASPHDELDVEGVNFKFMVTTLIKNLNRPDRLDLKLTTKAIDFFANHFEPNRFWNRLKPRLKYFMSDLMVFILPMIYVPKLIFLGIPKNYLALFIEFGILAFVARQFISRIPKFFERIVALFYFSSHISSAVRKAFIRIADLPDVHGSVAHEFVHLLEMYGVIPQKRSAVFSTVAEAMSAIEVISSMAFMDGKTDLVLEGISHYLSEKSFKDFNFGRQDIFNTEDLAKREGLLYSDAVTKGRPLHVDPEEYEYGYRTGRRLAGIAYRWYEEAARRGLKHEEAINVAWSYIRKRFEVSNEKLSPEESAQIDRAMSLEIHRKSRRPPKIQNGFRVPPSLQGRRRSHHSELRTAAMESAVVGLTLERPIDLHGLPERQLLFGPKALKLFSQISVVAKARSGDRQEKLIIELPQDGNSLNVALEVNENGNGRDQFSESIPQSNRAWRGNAAVESQLLELHWTPDGVRITQHAPAAASEITAVPSNGGAVEVIGTVLSNSPDFKDLSVQDIQRAEAMAASFRRVGYTKTLETFKIKGRLIGHRAYAHYIRIYKRWRPKSTTDYFALSYDEAVAYTADRRKVISRGLIESKQTAVNLMLAALDTIDGFKDLRLADGKTGKKDPKRVQKMLALYEREVMGYASKRPVEDEDKRRNGQIRFFSERGRLEWILRNDLPYLGKDKLASLLKEAVPELAEALHPTAIRTNKYWTEQKIKEHVWRALDSIRGKKGEIGFKKLRLATDEEIPDRVHRMAELYRREVIPYWSERLKRYGQLAFFKDKGGISRGTAMQLLKIAVPELVQQFNPEALRASELKRSVVPPKSKRRKVSTRRHELRQQDGFGSRSEMREAVQVLGAGGTIDMKGIESRSSADQVRRLVGNSANVNYQKIFERAPDSSNLEPDDWEKIIAEIYAAKARQGDSKNGIVVTTGTDRLSELALVLALEFGNKFPVFITAAYAPDGIPGSDARQNIVNSVRLAKSGIFPNGVYVVIGSEIHLASRILKIRRNPKERIPRIWPQPSKDRVPHPYRYIISAGGAIGRIRRNGSIKLKEDFLNWAARHQKSPPRKGNENFGYVERISIDTDTPKEILEDTKKRLLLLKSKDPSRRVGLLIQGIFHDNKELDAIRLILQEILSEQIPVAIASKEEFDALNLQDAILIPDNLPPSKLRTKMSWLLRHGTAFSQMKTELDRDYAGEVDISGISKEWRERWLDEGFYVMNDFRSGHGHFSDGQAVYIDFPGMNHGFENIPTQLEDLIHRLLLEKAKRGIKYGYGLIVNGYGNGHVAGPNHSIDEILFEFLAREKDRRKPFQKLFDDYTVFRAQNPKLEMIQDFLTEWFGSQTFKDRMQLAKHFEFSKEPIWVRDVNNLDRGVVDVSSLPETQAPFLMLTPDLLDRMSFIPTSSPGKQDDSKQFAEYMEISPHIFANRLIQDALMESHRNLRAIGEAKRQGVFINMYTRVLLTVMDPREYEIGNMLRAVGIDDGDVPWERPGWNPSPILLKSSIRSELRIHETSAQRLVDGIAKQLTKKVRLDSVAERQMGLSGGESVDQIRKMLSDESMVESALSSQWVPDPEFSYEVVDLLESLNLDGLEKGSKGKGRRFKAQAENQPETKALILEPLFQRNLKTVVEMPDYMEGRPGSDQPVVVSIPHAVIIDYVKKLEVTGRLDKKLVRIVDRKIPDLSSRRKIKSILRDIDWHGQTFLAKRDFMRGFLSRRKPNGARARRYFNALDFLRHEFNHMDMIQHEDSIAIILERKRVKLLQELKEAIQAKETVQADEDSEEFEFQSVERADAMGQKVTRRQAQNLEGLANTIEAINYILAVSLPSEAFQRLRALEKLEGQTVQVAPNLPVYKIEFSQNQLAVHQQIRVDPTKHEIGVFRKADDAIGPSDWLLFLRDAKTGTRIPGAFLRGHVENDGTIFLDFFDVTFLRLPGHGLFDWFRGMLYRLFKWTFLGVPGQRARDVFGLILRRIREEVEKLADATLITGDTEGIDTVFLLSEFTIQYYATGFRWFVERFLAKLARTAGGFLNLSFPGRVELKAKVLHDPRMQELLRRLKNEVEANQDLRGRPVGYGERIERLNEIIHILTQFLEEITIKDPVFVTAFTNALPDTLWAKTRYSAGLVKHHWSVVRLHDDLRTLRLGAYVLPLSPHSELRAKFLETGQVPAGPVNSTNAREREKLKTVIRFSIGVVGALAAATMIDYAFRGRSFWTSYFDMQKGMGWAALAMGSISAVVSSVARLVGIYVSDSHLSRPFRWLDVLLTAMWYTAFGAFTHWAFVQFDVFIPNVDFSHALGRAAAATIYGIGWSSLVDILIPSVVHQSAALWAKWKGDLKQAKTLKDRIKFSKHADRVWLGGVMRTGFIFMTADLIQNWFAIEYRVFFAFAIGFGIAIFRAAIAYHSKPIFSPRFAFWWGTLAAFASFGGKAIHSFFSAAPASIVFYGEWAVMGLINVGLAWLTFQYLKHRELKSSTNLELISSSVNSDMPTRGRSEFRRDELLQLKEKARSYLTFWKGLITEGKQFAVEPITQSNGRFLFSTYHTDSTRGLTGESLQAVEAEKKFKTFRFREGGSVFYETIVGDAGILIDPKPNEALGFAMADLCHNCAEIGFVGRQGDQTVIGATHYYGAAQLRYDDFLAYLDGLRQQHDIQVRGVAIGYRDDPAQKNAVRHLQNELSDREIALHEFPSRHADNPGTMVIAREGIARVVFLPDPSFKPITILGKPIEPSARSAYRTDSIESKLWHDLFPARAEMRVAHVWIEVLGGLTLFAAWTVIISRYSRQKSKSDARHQIELAEQSDVTQALLDEISDASESNPRTVVNNSALTQKLARGIANRNGARVTVSLSQAREAFRQIQGSPDSPYEIWRNGLDGYRVWKKKDPARAELRAPQDVGALRLPRQDRGLRMLRKPANALWRAELRSKIRLPVQLAYIPAKELPPGLRIDRIEHDQLHLEDILKRGDDALTDQEKEAFAHPDAVDWNSVYLPAILAAYRAYTSSPARYGTGQFVTPRTRDMTEHDYGETFLYYNSYGGPANLMDWASWRLAGVDPTENAGLRLAKGFLSEQNAFIKPVGSIRFNSRTGDGESSRSTIGVFEAAQGLYGVFLRILDQFSKLAIEDHYYRSNFDANLAGLGDHYEYKKMEILVYHMMQRPLLNRTLDRLVPEKIFDEFQKKDFIFYGLSRFFPARLKRAIAKQGSFDAEAEAERWLDQIAKDRWPIELFYLDRWYLDQVYLVLSAAKSQGIESAEPLWQAFRRHVKEASDRLEMRAKKSLDEKVLETIKKFKREGLEINRPNIAKALGVTVRAIGKVKKRNKKVRNEMNAHAKDPKDVGILAAIKALQDKGAVVTREAVVKEMGDDTHVDYITYRRSQNGAIDKAMAVATKDTAQVALDVDQTADWIIGGFKKRKNQITLPRPKELSDNSPQFLKRWFSLNAFDKNYTRKIIPKIEGKLKGKEIDQDVKERIEIGIGLRKNPVRGYARVFIRLFQEDPDRESAAGILKDIAERTGVVEGTVLKRADKMLPLVRSMIAEPNFSSKLRKRIAAALAGIRNVSNLRSSGQAARPSGSALSTKAPLRGGLAAARQKRKADKSISPQPIREKTMESELVETPQLPAEKTKVRISQSDFDKISQILDDLKNKFIRAKKLELDDTDTNNAFLEVADDFSHALARISVSLKIENLTDRIREFKTALSLLFTHSYVTDQNFYKPNNKSAVSLYRGMLADITSIVKISERTGLRPRSEFRKFSDNDSLDASLATDAEAGRKLKRAIEKIRASRKETPRAELRKRGAKLVEFLTSGNSVQPQTAASTHLGDARSSFLILPKAMNNLGFVFDQIVEAVHERNELKQEIIAYVDSPLTARAIRQEIRDVPGAERVRFAFSNEEVFREAERANVTELHVIGSDGELNEPFARNLEEGFVKRGVRVIKKNVGEFMSFLGEQAAELYQLWKSALLYAKMA